MQRAKRRSRSHPAQVEPNIPLERNTIVEWVAGGRVSVKAVNVKGFGSVGSGFVLVRGIRNGGICGSGFRIEVVGSDGAGRGGARWRCGKEDAR